MEEVAQAIRETGDEILETIARRFEVCAAYFGREDQARPGLVAVFDAVRVQVLAEQARRLSPIGRLEDAELGHLLLMARQYRGTTGEPINVGEEVMLAPEVTSDLDPDEKPAWNALLIEATEERDRRHKARGAS
jgi:hypothetical protein